MSSFLGSSAQDGKDKTRGRRISGSELWTFKGLWRVDLSVDRVVGKERSRNDDGVGSKTGVFTSRDGRRVE